MSFTLNPLKMSLPIKVILIVLFVGLFGDMLPIEVKEFLYAISLTMKEMLMFMLPLVIFSYLASCILSFEKGAGVILFLGVLLTGIYASNFVACIASYPATFVSNSLIGAAAAAPTGGEVPILNSLWSFNIPEYVDIKHVLIAGLLTGMVFTFIRVRAVERFTNLLKGFCDIFLMKLFTPLVPIFILGFMVRLQHEGMLKTVLTSYAPLFFYTIVINLLYITLLFILFNGFNLRKAFMQLRNCTSAAVTGFSSMSSAVSMPFTLRAAEANTGNPIVAKSVIPATVNPHMIGNALIIPMLAGAIMMNNGVAFPDFSTYIGFAALFAITQFAAAAVPSGGILIMIPHLQNYMGFTPGMCELIITIYMFFDAPITAGNITGNIAFTTGINKILVKLGIVPEAQEENRPEEDVEE